MSRAITIFLLVLFSLLSSCIGPVFSEQQPAVPPFQLTPITDSSTELFAASKIRSDLKLFVPLVGTAIGHIFLLRNDYKFPLTIDHFQSSCGCTSAYVGGTPQNNKTIILPGQQIDVHVSIDPTQLHAEPIDKIVWVYIRGQDEPAATLELIGTALPRAVFSVPQINFGRVEAGTSRVIPLTVSFGASPVRSVNEIRVFSSNSDVQVHRTTDAINPSQTEPLTQNYSVSILPTAHLSSIGSRIIFLLKDNLDGSEYMSGSIAVTGDVIGQIAVSPTIIGFGTVTTGTRSTQYAMLTGTNIKDVKVISNSSYITSFIKPAVEGNNSSRVLEIVLAPELPLGVLQSTVTITTANGEKLVLPVCARIVSH